MTAAQRVIDDIDALVDEQLAAGEAPGGYDYNDPEFPRCRCGCMWHGLSRSGCPGSDVEGPAMVTGLRFGNWASGLVLPSRRLGHFDFDPADSIAAVEGLEQITAAFRVVSAEVSRVWESIRRTLLGLPHPQSQSRCTLAARRRMHSDQLRVQRRVVRRERRARRRCQASGDDAIALAESAGLHLDPWQQQVLRASLGERVEVHEGHVILTLTPDVSGFRRELGGISG